MRASHTWCAEQHHATGSTPGRGMLHARWLPTRRPNGCVARGTCSHQAGRPPLPWQLHAPGYRQARCHAAVQPSAEDPQPAVKANVVEAVSSTASESTTDSSTLGTASSTSSTSGGAGPVPTGSSSTREITLPATAAVTASAPAASSAATSTPTPPSGTNATVAAEATTAAAAAGSSPTQQPAEAAAAAQGPAALLATLRSLWLRLVAALARLVAPITSLPAWVARQRLAALAAEADAAPGDAPKQAAYLAGLNAAGRAPEVLTRVDSGKYGVNAAVVVEYITALVASRQLEQYARASSTADPAAPAAAAAAAAGAGGGAGGAQGSEGAALAALLGRLQLAAAGGDAAGGAGEGGGRLGASRSRPLHVVLQGGGPYPGSLAAPASSRSAPLPAAAPLSPVARLAAIAWNLVLLLVSLLLLAGLYLAGRATWRALSTGAPLPGSDAAGAGASSSVVSSSAGAGAGPGGLSTGGGGGSAFDPKEYKKDELPETSVKTFADVKGCDESKAELQEVVEFLKNPAKFTRLGAKLPKGILLTGPPGTGKTLLAKAVAGEAGVPFFYRAGSEFEELYVGVGSRRMRALFAAAKKRAPCIVFIDEIDAIGGNRKHWENHTRKTLNQLLVEMDGFEPNEGVIVMAATNLPETLDPALKRPGRFDRQVAVPLPDVAGRRQMLDYYLGDKPVAPDVDASVLARNTAGFSGADISNLVNEAALLAAKQGADSISASMLDWAYDKVLMGVERLSAVRSPEARRRTAYHEGGHALVAAAVAGASPLHKATIIPRGHALGMVQQMGRDDEYSISRQQMMARILVALGGTVAEELIYGRDGVTSGATDDLRQATEMARHMVMQCGLSEAVGPLYVADEKSLSETMKQAVDEEVRTMLMEARGTVKSLLTGRLEDLHRLAGALLEHETLTGAQIKAVLAGEVLLPPAGNTPSLSSSSSNGGEVKVPEPVAAPEAV